MLQFEVNTIFKKNLNLNYKKNHHIMIDYNFCNYININYK